MAAGRAREARGEAPRSEWQHRLRGHHSVPRRAPGAGAKVHPEERMPGAPVGGGRGCQPLATFQSPVSPLPGDTRP